MHRKYFIICVTFSLWTIIQTSLHLFFVIYAYYMSICEESPTRVETIFFYLTYLYDRKCGDIKLGNPNISALSKIQSYIFSVVAELYFKDNNDTVNVERVINKLLDNINLFPEQAIASTRTSVYLLCFIILDSVWIISAVALFMGTICEIKQSLALIFYGPWLVTTVCVSIFDAAASIVFGLDIAETTNFSNWLKFVGVEDMSKLTDLDEVNPLKFFPLAPTLALCSVSSRFIVIWIGNLIGFFFVMKSTMSVYKETYKNEIIRRRNIINNTHRRNRLDLDSSAARIRSWQLFYGAVDTISSHSSKSTHSETDLNSNSKENKDNAAVGNIDVENQPSDALNVPTISGNGNSSYYAYSDVAENIDNGNFCMHELRSQLPWSYFPEENPTRKEEKIELENKTRRNIRLTSDLANSVTKL